MRVSRECGIYPAMRSRLSRTVPPPMPHLSRYPQAPIPQQHEHNRPVCVQLARRQHFGVKGETTEEPRYEAAAQTPTTLNPYHHSITSISTSSIISSTIIFIIPIIIISSSSSSNMSSFGFRYAIPPYPYPYPSPSPYPYPISIPIPLTSHPTPCPSRARSPTAHLASLSHLQVWLAVVVGFQGKLLRMTV